MVLKYVHEFFDSSLTKCEPSFSSSGLWAGLSDSPLTTEWSDAVWVPASTWLFFCWDASLRTQPPFCEEAQATWRGKEAPGQQPAPTGRPVSEQGFESSNWGSKHQEQRQAIFTVLCPHASSVDSMFKINGCFMPLHSVVIYYAVKWLVYLLIKIVLEVFLNTFWLR